MFGSRGCGVGGKGLVGRPEHRSCNVSRGLWGFLRFRLVEVTVMVAILGLERLFCLLYYGHTFFSCFFLMFGFGMCKNGDGFLDRFRTNSHSVLPQWKPVVDSRGLNRVDLLYSPMITVFLLIILNKTRYLILPRHPYKLAMKDDQSLNR